MQDDKFKRNLYKNSRITIDFFMHSPKALCQKGKMPTDGATYTLNYNPVIFIKPVNPNSLNESFQSSDNFKVTPKNLYRTVKFFNKVLSWFTDKDKIDLFLTDEENNLIFNADYNKLSAMVGFKGTETCVMKAIPSIVDVGGQKHEGINLYINREANLIQLTVDELATIFDLFKTFSFPEEMVCNLIALQYAASIGNIETDITRWNSKTYQRIQNSTPVNWNK